MASSLPLCFGSFVVVVVTVAVVVAFEENMTEDERKDGTVLNCTHRPVEVHSTVL